MKAAFFRPTVNPNPAHARLLGPEVPVSVGAVIDCEVTEFEEDEGWKQWQDSVFIQDFEDSVLASAASVCGRD